uniref:Uncharacterized protein n=1 Tax=Corethron hystrix TaxID=216773 RepID=A0A7S1BPS0_9STRA|mmetsp:Transcript_36487/g.85285  ORF Transcript_36487/g.85285 Transcript_36487/m.85285 type:complete len:326 (+) Transcript_36487:293-1270(+)
MNPVGTNASIHYDHVLRKDMQENITKYQLFSNKRNQFQKNTSHPSRDENLEDTSLKTYIHGNIPLPDNGGTIAKTMTTNKHATVCTNQRDHEQTLHPRPNGAITFQDPPEADKAGVSVAFDNHPKKEANNYIETVDSSFHLQNIPGPSINKISFSKPEHGCKVPKISLQETEEICKKSQEKSLISESGLNHLAGPFVENLLSRNEEIFVSMEGGNKTIVHNATISKLLFMMLRPGYNASSFETSFHLRKIEDIAIEFEKNKQREICDAVQHANNEIKSRHSIIIQACEDQHNSQRAAKEEKKKAACSCKGKGGRAGHFRRNGSTA